jgi:hypothetical protein
MMELGWLEISPISWIFGLCFGAFEVEERSLKIIIGDSQCLLPLSSP